MRCDACGDTIRAAQHYTDEAVCGTSDGPGFYLCGRRGCVLHRPTSIVHRRAYYAAGRVLNALAPRLRRALLTVRQYAVLP